MADSIPSSLLGVLPTPRTRLIGRETERATARALLLEEAIPLLSLVGPGGVGKTRLAQAIANDVASSFGDGVVWVDLAPLEDSALVASAVAAALGYLPTKQRPLADDLVRHLHARQILLLLDNCEHVLAETATLADLLVTYCPAVQVLATSRAPLRVRAERVLSVAPLPLPVDAASSLEVLADNPAVRLFVDRARAVRPGFLLIESNAATVAAICRHLDGLPLAIELAAARLPLLSAEALLAQVSDRLRLLGDGPRDLPDRQRTLHDTIAWSYHLLAAEERTLFRRLAVFVGEFTLEAALAVAIAEGQDAEPGLGGLAALLEHSLLQRLEDGDHSRFVMLETIRAFAQTQLSGSPEETDTRAAHAAYFLAVAERVAPSLAGNEQKQWLAYLDPHHGDLLAAIAWFRAQGQIEHALRLGGALWRFWWLRSHLDEGRIVLDAALQDTGPVAPVIRATALRGSGVLAESQHDWNTAIQLHQQSLAISRSSNDLLGEAWSLHSLALVEINQGHIAQSSPLLEECLSVAERTGDAATIATTLIDLGHVAFNQQDWERAISLLTRALELSCSIDDASNKARVLNNLGVIAIEQKEFARAKELLTESLSLFRGLDDLEGVAATLTNLGDVSNACGDQETAMNLYWASHQLALDENNLLGAGGAMESLATLARQLGDGTTAQDRFRDALVLYRKAVDHQGICACLAGMALTVAPTSPRPAARLLAAVEHLRGDHTLDAPAGKDAHEMATGLATLRATLGPGEFAMAWEQGQKLRMEEAIAEALTLPSMQVRASDPEHVPTGTGPFGLTRRELEVLELLVQRLTNKEIADALYVGPRTVQTHTISIFTKLGVDNRRDAAARALAHGLA